MQYYHDLPTAVPRDNPGVIFQRRGTAVRWNTYRQYTTYEQRQRVPAILISEVSAIHGYFRDIIYQNNPLCPIPPSLVNVPVGDGFNFLYDCNQMIVDRLLRLLHRYPNGFRMAMRFDSWWIKQVPEAAGGGLMRRLFTYYSSVAFCLTEETVVDAVNHLIHDMIEEALFQQTEATNVASGYGIDFVRTITISISKRDPTHPEFPASLGARGYIATPAWFQIGGRRRGIVNVKNYDNRCFLYAICSMLHYDEITDHRDRPGKYDSFLRRFEGISADKFPFKIRDIEWFEKKFRISVNVYCVRTQEPMVYKALLGRNQVCEGATADLFQDTKSYITLLRPTKTLQVDHVDLLYLYDAETNNAHYAGIRSLSALVSQEYGTSVKRHICPYCQHAYTAADALTRHLDRGCRQVTSAGVVYPKEGDVVTFKMEKAEEKMDCMVYYDFEACVAKSLDNDEAEFRQNHIPCGYSIIMIKNGQIACSFVRCIPDEKMLMDTFFGDLRACSKLYRSKNREPLRVVAHNAMKYDNHFVLRNAGSRGMKIEVIPTTMENFITMNIGNFEFLDSLRFLPESLQNLANYLTGGSSGGVIQHPEKLPITMELMIEYLTNTMTVDEETCQATVLTLLRKGVYPYEYMDTADKFEEQLPTQEQFFSKLKGPCSDEDYLFAQHVFSITKCRNMRDYHNIYVQVDTALLADIFENFRTGMMKTHALDPAYFKTLASFSWNCMLRCTKECSECKVPFETSRTVVGMYSCPRCGNLEGECIKLDLLHDPDMYNMVELAKRGGLVTVGCQRHVKANNSHCEWFDPAKEKTCIRYFDANNLYGGMMIYRPLPYGNFQWVERECLWYDAEYLQSHTDEMLKDDEVGFFLRVDLLYPNELHDEHKDHPLAAESFVVKEEMLSEWQKEQLKRLGLKFSETPRLCATLYDKKSYVIHCRNLDFYVKEGLKIGKVYDILMFRQSPFLSEYIEVNTRERIRFASEGNDFMATVMKLMSNIIYGKSVESSEHYNELIFVSTEEEARKRTNSHLYKGYDIISENLVAIRQHKNFVKRNKPNYVGVSILELSKEYMERFHMSIKRKLGAKYLYGDTDSLVLLFPVENIDDYMLTDLSEWYDTSNYPADHPLYFSRNKKVPLKFKNEVPPPREVTEIIVESAKMYHISVSDGKHIFKAKGVPESSMVGVGYGDYLSAIQNERPAQTVQFTTISSSNQRLFTETLHKIGISNYEEKVYVLPDGINCLPYGHYSLRS